MLTAQRQGESTTALAHDSKCRLLTCAMQHVDTLLPCRANPVLCCSAHCYSAPHYAVLRSVVLCCAMLYCTVLCCTMLCSSVPGCAMLCSSVLCRAVPCRAVLCCAVPNHYLIAGTGAISWFPVHCTSINNTNDLISGDNKGVASQFMEKWAVKKSAAANSKTTVVSSSTDGGSQVADDFIAAFGQANVGDTSPNIQGAFCQDTGTLLLLSCSHLMMKRIASLHGQDIGPLSLQSCSHVIIQAHCFFPSANTHTQVHVSELHVSLLHLLHGPPTMFAAGGLPQSMLVHAPCEGFGL